MDYENEMKSEPDGQIDKERRPPRHVLNQPATKHRSDSSRDCAEGRPRSNRPPAVLFGKGITDDGQAAGSDQRCAKSLNSACRNQLRDVCREAARYGCDGKD